MNTVSQSRFWQDAFGKVRLILKGIRLYFNKKGKTIASWFIRSFFTIAENVVFSVNAGSARSYTVMAGIAILVVAMNALHLEKTGILQAFGVSGGPEQEYGIRVSAFGGKTFPAQSPGTAESALRAMLSGLQETGIPAGAFARASAQTSNAILTYEAKQGDSVQSVARAFGVSENTIRWVNNLKTDEFVSGQRLLVLPLSGILHRVVQGETIDTIAAQYGISVARIRAANGLGSENIAQVGSSLIIPGADATQSIPFALAVTPSSGGGGFSLRIPTTGWNWGKLHFNNAVDIANECGTPVYASAAGVISRAAQDGWNDGLGVYVAIDHGNGVETVYAHLSAAFVAPGTRVQAGDIIGSMGKSGRADGVNGCHVHFEVSGAKNPFADE